MSHVFYSVSLFQKRVTRFSLVWYLLYLELLPTGFDIDSRCKKKQIQMMWRDKNYQTSRGMLTWKSKQKISVGVKTDRDFIWNCIENKKHLQKLWYNIWSFQYSWANIVVRVWNRIMNWNMHLRSESERFIFCCTFRTDLQSHFKNSKKARAELSGSAICSYISTGVITESLFSSAKAGTDIVIDIVCPFGKRFRDTR